MLRLRALMQGRPFPDMPFMYEKAYCRARDKTPKNGYRQKLKFTRQVTQKMLLRNLLVRKSVCWCWLKSGPAIPQVLFVKMRVKTR